MISRILQWSTNVTERDESGEMKIINGVYHDKTILFHVFSCNFDRAEEYHSLYLEQMLVSTELVDCAGGQQKHLATYLLTLS